MATTKKHKISNDFFSFKNMKLNAMWESSYDKLNGKKKPRLKFTQFTRTKEKQNENNNNQKSKIEHKTQNKYSHKIMMKISKQNEKKNEWINSKN